MTRKPKNFSRKITDWIGSTESLIAHTIFFVGVFALKFLGVSSSEILLILTTIVSLEAIYLAIFIQITINEHSDSLEEVSEDIEELQEDVEEIQEDVEEISEDVEEIQKDVDEIQEDVEEISEDEEKIEQTEREEKEKFIEVEKTLQTLIKEITELKNSKK